MATELTLDLWTVDVGAEAASVEAFASAIAQRVEESWDSGADLVLLPEFTWVGLEPLLPVRHVTEASPALPSLRRVAETFWQQVMPMLAARLDRLDKAAVLGTAPYYHSELGQLRNRAVIIASGKVLYQDKLHLTPWENAFSPGTQLRLLSFGGLRIAVIICLDIEIPELAARLRGLEVDLVLCPSATESILGVERVNRCASARAVELGCYVGVAHLVGKTKSDLIDENIGRVALYGPSQAMFRKAPRWEESEVFESGCHRLRTTLSIDGLRKMRRMIVETNPALLGREAAGMNRALDIRHDP